MTESAIPVAIPQQPVATERAPLIGKGVEPPVAPSQGSAVNLEPSLDAFAKIAAERRSRASTPPVAVPFGNGTIRIHGSMPASFAADLITVDSDPAGAVRALRAVIIDADREQFEAILKLPPDNEHGIDGAYLFEFLGVLGEFYSGNPLGG